MEAKFYRKKINKLSDERLIDLLRTTNNPANTKIFELTKEELVSRNLTIELEIKSDPQKIVGEIGELEQLKTWNWGAFIFAPVWTVANKLEFWTFLCFIPFVNIIVMFYLGFNGNRLAYKKSTIKSVDDFMTIQKSWRISGSRLFWMGLIAIFLLILRG